ncbi:LysR family transcriptional regulator [Permianibacter sp. IMCC34836]|uniref:LysR family transcriptional regulator n=1 Tax=Permianibacter fluminis TaxID=2738515 RepID=UPI0015556776|nr:LysR family transcriptional regulator [Permianibacter fluminis]NQD37141.1 LysR family transcriptional regulator [Permianibacter fluminis]
MNQTDAMRIFLRVAELASFTQAADSMGLPKASISAAVQQLETEFGTRLLHRTTRKVQMTQDGLTFYERCKDLLADIDELQTLFQAGEAGLAGRIRVDMSSGIAKNVIVPKLAEFLRAHPRIEIELSSTDRRVDVVREGFDCVIRVGNVLDSSLIARPIGQYALLNCVSPSYVAQHGLPQTLADLAQHQLVHYVPTLGGKSTGFEYVDDHNEPQAVAMSGAITVNNSDAYLAACLAGLGIIQVPDAAVRAALATGELLEVLPQYRAAPMPISLLYANRRHLPKRVKAFMDWVTATLQAYLVRDSS